LSREDLKSRTKNVEDINISDFRNESITFNGFYKSSLVTFVDVDGKIKILKDRRPVNLKMKDKISILNGGNLLDLKTWIDTKIAEGYTKYDVELEWNKWYDNDMDDVKLEAKQKGE